MNAPKRHEFPDEEIWSKTEDLPSYWEVSTHGRVRILEREILVECHGVSKSTVRKKYKGRIQKTSARRNRRVLAFSTQIDSKVRVVYVGRLVAQTFIPNPKRYGIVGYHDGDPTNCRADNLFWTLKPIVTRLDHDTVIAIRESVAAGSSMKSQASLYGVSKSLIKSAVTGNTYAHVGGPLSPGYRAAPKLSADQVRDIRRRFKAGERGVDLAKEFQKTTFTISRIVNHRMYKDIQ